MTIFPIRAFQDNYIWAWVNRAEQSMSIVDPGIAEPVLAYLHAQDLTLSNILLTHHHADHIGGVPELLHRYPECRVYGPSDERINGLSHPMQDNDVVQIGNYTFRIIGTPGHTSSHICYFEINQKYLFCGDTLFSAGCGRVFDGTMEQLYDSLQRINQLPDETFIFCGHEYTLANLPFAAWVEPNNQAIQEYRQVLIERKSGCSLPSTLQLERTINPFLRTNTGQLIEFARQQGIDVMDSFAIFKQLREIKNRF